MPKKSKTPYLFQHYNTWYFRFGWPKDVRPFVRETEFIRSLGTDNLFRAQVERDVLLAGCKRAVVIYRSGDKTARDEELLAFQKRYKEEVTFEKEELDAGYTSESLHDLQEEIFERAVDLNVEGGMSALRKEHAKHPTNPTYNDALKSLGAYEKVQEYRRLASGDKEVPINLVHYLNEWVSWRGKDVSQKTVDDGKSQVLRFAEQFPTIKEVTEHEVWRWFENLRHEVSLRRRRKIKGHLVNYWKYLQRNLAVPAVAKDFNPFADILTEEKEKSFDNVAQETWQPLPKLGEDAVFLLHAVEEARNPIPLWELMFVLMYTGMRVEEAGQLTKGDVNMDDRYIHITKSKTQWGIRQVPIHDNLKPWLLNKIENSTKEDKREYLIENLNSNNKYGIRTVGTKNKFSRLKTQLGYGKETVLYSIRKTVITLMHQANVRTDVIPYIVGHKPESFSLSRYSGGASMEQKLDAIHAIQYPEFDHRWSLTTHHR